MPTVLLTLEDLSSRLGVSISTVRRMRAGGLLPDAIELPGGTVRFSADEVDAWLAEMKQQATRRQAARQDRSPLIA